MFSAELPTHIPCGAPQCMNHCPNNLFKTLLYNKRITVYQKCYSWSISNVHSMVVIGSGTRNKMWVFFKGEQDFFDIRAFPLMKVTKKKKKKLVRNSLPLTPLPKVSYLSKVRYARWICNYLTWLLDTVYAYWNVTLHSVCTITMYFNRKRWDWGGPYTERAMWGLFQGAALWAETRGRRRQPSKAKMGKESSRHGKRFVNSPQHCLR